MVGCAMPHGTGSRASGSAQWLVEATDGTIPILMLYLSRRYDVAGIAASGVKG